MAAKKPLTKLNWSPATCEREIMKAARRLASLQRKRRAVTKMLSTLAADIRAAKRELRIATQQAIDVDPMTPPLREFGERGGL